MFEKLKNKSEFFYHVFTLMTGTVVAQGIIVLISPLLTRLYSPSNFGVFTLYISIVSIISVIACGRYELTIILPKRDKDAINIVALAMLMSLIIGLILMIFVILFHAKIMAVLRNREIGPWLYLVPFAILAQGVFNALTYYHTRIKSYKKIAGANIYKSIVTVIFQLGLKLLTFESGGLILGRIIGVIFGNVKLFCSLFRNKKIIAFISIKGIKKQALRYIDFLIFSVPSGLLNSLFFNLMNILIAASYSVIYLGYYALAFRVVALPLSLIGIAFSQVFMQKASEDKHLYGNITQIFNATFKKMVFISIPLFVLLFIFAPYIFPIIFGHKWLVVGYYVRILAPYYAIQFLATTLSLTLAIFEKQKQALIINIILVLALILLFLWSRHFDYSFRKFLILYSVIMSGIYLLRIGYYKKVSLGKIGVS
jgi:O-antigen/teichoic acid export membrane protein